MQSSIQSRRRLGLALVSCALSCFVSCKLVETAVKAPVKATSAVLGGDKDEKPRVAPNVVQTGVMRFADTFASKITYATQEFARIGGTPDARIQGLTWAIGQLSSAYTIASGENTNIALLDMVVLVSLNRLVHEEYWKPKVWGDADQPMIDAFTQLESDVWGVAQQVFTEQQQQRIRATLDDWRASNPDVSVTAFVRLPKFKDMLTARKESQDPKLLEDVGNLLSLDPLSGLEPAVRQVELARQFGERTLFYAQRMPLVISMQVELMTLKTARLDEVQSVLADTQRVSKAVADFAETAKKLPEDVRAEREAAVQQISDELTEQREGLVADLEKAQEPTNAILAQARETLAAGTEMSTALQGTLQSLDAFVARFDKPPAPVANDAPPKPPGKPFDVSDYGAAAERVGIAAHELNGLIATLDQSLPRVQTMIDEVAQRGDRTIDHAFARGLALGLSLIAATAVAVLAVRWISSRTRRAAV
jgi:hypothetical protein